MDLKQIKDLMTFMEKAGTKRVKIKQDNFELELEREGELPAPAVVHQVAAPAAQPSHHQMSDIPANLHPPHQTTPVVEQNSGNFVTSPMVGTFYTTPSPEEPPFVKVGDKIDKDTVVCIIEAMKVMNEVKAGVSGTVTETLVENGHPVEFGSKLFKIV